MNEGIPELLVKLRWALYQQFNVVASRVEIYTRNDPKHPICLPVPDGVVAPQGPAPGPAREQPAAAGAKLVSLERRILKAAAALEEEEPTSAQIAAATKNHDDVYLRKLLELLRRRGFLGGERGSAGYPITAAGLAALEGENPP